MKEGKGTRRDSIEKRVLACLKKAGSPMRALSIVKEINKDRAFYDQSIRARLSQLVKEGKVVSHGRKGSRRYQLPGVTVTEEGPLRAKFKASQEVVALKQIESLGAYTRSRFDFLDEKLAASKDRSKEMFERVHVQIGNLSLRNKELEGQINALEAKLAVCGGFVAIGFGVSLASAVITLWF